MKWIHSDAIFSDCGAYRYMLFRVWRSTGPLCNFLMLNPSTADAERNDPTVERCERYARRWGFSGLLVTNIYAYRATDPRVMFAAEDPVGPRNDEAISVASAICPRVVCAWGADRRARDRGAAALTIVRQSRSAEVVALKLTKDGAPSHPLYLRADIEPFQFGNEG